MLHRHCCITRCCIPPTGADVLDADLLAGALLDAVASKDAATRAG
jgi:hypothetical protein